MFRVVRANGTGKGGRGLRWCTNLTLLRARRVNGPARPPAGPHASGEEEGTGAV